MDIEGVLPCRGLVFSEYPLRCIINTGIILMGDILEAVRRVQERSEWFLMTAQRTDLDWAHPLSFEKGWDDRLLREASRNGKLHHFTEIDFWIYPKSLL